MATAAAFMLVLLSAEPVKPSITVVVRGADITQAQLDQAAPGVVLERAEPPNVGATPTAAPALPQERIAAARKAYVDADFNKCLEQVADDGALTAALGEGDRPNAARVLLWRVACNVGAGKLEPARRAATQLAVSSLQVPAEAGSVSPEVEAVIAKAFGQVAAMKPVPFSVGGTKEASVELDGRPTGCTTPCSLEVLEGLHVVRLNADGHESAVRPVRVEAPRGQVDVELPPAAPELAAAQWSARYKNASDVDGARSVRLLSTALRASRLIMLTAEEGAGGKLQAVLATDGAVTARAERSELDGLLNDLLVRGQVIEASVPIYKRPLFWIAVVVAAGAAAAGTAIYFTYDPKKITEVVVKF